MPKGKGYKKSHNIGLGIAAAFKKALTENGGSVERGAKGSPNLKDVAAVIKKRKLKRKSILEELDK